MNKHHEIETNIEIYQPQIIGILESWCNSSILDSELAFSGYTLFRRDKDGSDGRGGGVLLYIHDSIDATQYCDLDNIVYETSIWCEVKLNGNDNLLVGLVYRSPNESTDENNKALRQQLTTASNTGFTHFLIFGDFNYREINWSMNTVAGGTNSEPQLFMDTVHDLLLVQHVEKPTRGREGQKPSLLDLVLTNNENSIDEITHHAAVGKSDHDSLIWSYTYRLETSCSNKDRLNFAKGNYTIP